MTNPQDILANLIASALQSGATGAKCIDAREIVVNDDLAAICGNDPACEHYGLAMSCPPHVRGPAAFRQWQTQSKAALVVKIDLPAQILFSAERREIMQLLHEIVANVELHAKRKGFADSKAFAGGSCRNIWCRDKPSCRVLTDDGLCRNPDKARPSMSGFGIDVTRLLQSAGWDVTLASSKSAADGQMAWVAGLVLVA